jgi:hypothetical protein
MATFDQSIVSVYGRLTHSWDFAFYKNNGEIANRMRSVIGSDVKDIRIDKDGDIDIEIKDEGNFLITPGAVIAAGWLTDSKSLSEKPEIEKFASIIQSLAEIRGSFAVEFYNIRLFLRFRPDNSLSLLREQGFESSFRLICGEKTPSDIMSFKFSTTRNRGKFLDSVELEASLKEVQYRYSRIGAGADFDSYSTFVAAADIPGLLEELRPFAETLLAAEPRGLGLNLGRSLLSDMK